MVPFPEPGTRLWSLLGFGPAAARRAARWTGWLGPLLVSLFAGVLRFWHLGSPQRGHLRRDVLRQGRLGAAAPGLRGHLAEQRQLADPAAPPGSPAQLGARPTSCTRRSASGSSRWASGSSGCNPSAGGSWSRCSARSSVLMLCRIGRRLLRSTALGCLAGAADVGRRPAIRDEPHRAARPHRDVLGAGRPSAACWSTATTRGPGWRPRCPPTAGRTRPRPVDATGPAAVAAGGRRAARPGPARRSGTGLFYLAAFAVMLPCCGTRRPGGWPAPLSGRPARCCGATRCRGRSCRWCRWRLQRPTCCRWTRLVPDRQRLLTGTGRTAAAERGRGLPAPLRSLWHYQYQIYLFNINLNQPHTYQSNPWSWLVLGRPVSVLLRVAQAGPGRLHRRRRLRLARCWRSAPRCSGGRPASRCSTCSTAGRCAATGGRARCCAGWAPATCPGSTTSSGRSSPSTRSSSCRSLLAVAMMLGAALGPRGSLASAAACGAPSASAPCAPHHLELPLLLPALHGHDDPDRGLAESNVAGYVDLGGGLRRGAPASAGSPPSPPAGAVSWPGVEACVACTAPGLSPGARRPAASAVGPVRCRPRRSRRRRSVAARAGRRRRPRGG